MSFRIMEYTNVLCHVTIVENLFKNVCFTNINICLFNHGNYTIVFTNVALWHVTTQTIKQGKTKNTPLLEQF